MEREKYDIEIDMAEALRYMGFGCAATDGELREMLELAALIKESGRPRVIIKELAIEAAGEGVALSGQGGKRASGGIRGARALFDRPLFAGLWGSANFGAEGFLRGAGHGAEDRGACEREWNYDTEKKRDGAYGRFKGSAEKPEHRLRGLRANQ